MLIRFSAESYLSIKDKAVLSLLFSRNNEHPEHLITDGNKNYLKSVTIYGTSAFGKSNVLSAFWFMIDYVLIFHNQQLHRTITHSPFKFNPGTPTRPNSFRVIFTTGSVRCAHGFPVTDKAVTEEHLYYYPNGRQALIFEGKNTKDFRFTASVDEQNALKERTPVGKLYLSVASNWSYAKVILVLEWFVSCQIITKNSAADAYGIKVKQLKNNDYRCVITSILRVADLGIQALQMRNSDPVPSQYNDIFTNVDTIHIVRDADGNACSCVLNIAEESDGTNSYFELIGVVKEALDLGTLLVVDEMGAHPHPLLIKHLAPLFDSTEFNPRSVQLIFTSHGTNLPDSNFLGRDRIWLTERDEQTAAADLSSLCDFSIRKDTKVEKGCLIGRFGVIPFIKGGLQNGAGTD